MNSKFKERRSSFYRRVCKFVKDLRYQAIMADYLKEASGICPG
jgi:hypothetical protein